MSQPYRALAVVPDYLPVAVHHKGPREACPVCSSWQKYKSYGPNLLVKNDVRACTSASWWRRFFFGGCARRDLHGHQRCATCGARWIIDCVEDV